MSIFLLSLVLLLSPHAPLQNSAPSSTADSASVVLLSPEQVEKLLPATVFFHGQTAPLQLRNAAAARLPGGGIFFASLVDTSGYATSVRERYQFYLVTEAPLLIAGKSIPAGAYGAGFLEDGTFVVMDIGGHDLLLSTTRRDDGLRHPRPLQLVTGTSAGELRLYLGRSFVTLTPSAR